MTMGAKLKVVYARKHFGDFAYDYLKLKRRLTRLPMRERHELRDDGHGSGVPRSDSQT
jgi:hypothetical protein